MPSCCHSRFAGASERVHLFPVSFLTLSCHRAPRKLCRRDCPVAIIRSAGLFRRHSVPYRLVPAPDRRLGPRWRSVPADRHTTSHRVGWCTSGKCPRRSSLVCRFQLGFAKSGLVGASRARHRQGFEQLGRRLRPRLEALEYRLGIIEEEVERWAGAAETSSGVLHALSQEEAAMQPLNAVLVVRRTRGTRRLRLGGVRARLGTRRSRSGERGC